MSANAALVSSNWKATGDGLATLDTDTGIEWLDLTQTLGKSISEIQTEFTSTLSGWRLPTKQEVNSLLSTVFNVTPFNPGYSAVTYSAEYLGGGSAVSPNYRTVYGQFDAMLNKFGNTYYKDTYGSTYFQTNRNATVVYQDTPGGAILSASLQYQYRLTYSTGREVMSVKLIEDLSSGLTASSKDINTSVFLVSDGGATLSSQLDPTININNPNAPVNQVPVEPELPDPSPADVPAPAAIWFTPFFLFAAFFRRKAAALKAAKPGRKTQLMWLPFAVLWSFSPVSHASLVNADWTTTGDMKSAIDTRTGLEWLDLTVTDGMSISAVLAQTAEGGLFAGWRLPTYAEVLGLLKTSTGLTLSAGQVVEFSTPYGTLDNEFSRAIGINHTTGKTSSYTTYALGLFIDSAGNIRHAGTSDVRYGYRRIHGGSVVSSGTTSYSAPDFGVFLVSDGGLTIASIENPDLLANNPKAPVNQVPDEPQVPNPAPADVPSPSTGLFALPFLALFFRRKVGPST